MSHRVAPSSELTAADMAEMLALFEPRPTGHTVVGWLPHHLLVLSDGPELHPADSLWLVDVELGSVNAVNPITLRDTGQEMRFCVLSTRPFANGWLVETHPNLVASGQYQNITREPRAGDAVWALHRKDAP
jgi:hypothetical protein